jgi:hypothetical protein
MYSTLFSHSLKVAASERRAVVRWRGVAAAGAVVQADAKFQWAGAERAVR